MCLESKPHAKAREHVVTESIYDIKRKKKQKKTYHCHSDCCKASQLEPSHLGHFCAKPTRFKSKKHELALSHRGKETACLVFRRDDGTESQFVCALMHFVSSA